VAVIPARGGSKGIPRKNLLQINGHPLIAWSIWSATGARQVSRVMVSTDDEQIAAVARQYGAEVVMRPAHLSHDSAPSEAALLHVLDHLEALGNSPELLVFLQATSPIRQAMDIDGAIDRLRAEQVDACFSACAEHFTGRWRRDGNGSMMPVNFAPDARPMRQDYPVEYLENGSIYVLRPRVLREFNSRMGGRLAVYPMNAVKSLQLDELEDIVMIESAMRGLGLGAPLAAQLLRWQRIRLLVMDFDGVLTDNRVWVNGEGEESVACSRADSLGLSLLRRAGLEMLVLSTETHPVVAQRCRKLALPCHTGESDKVAFLQSFIASRGLDPAEVAFVGNDINDLECMRLVGLSVAPADASPEVLEHATLVTAQTGGQGAVRQVAEWFLAAMNAQGGARHE
jgi:N-acylneuraminate cytidylyltransferase